MQVDKLANRLSPEHKRELAEGSGISPELIEARGYWTATDKAELRKLGFANNQLRVPALVVPMYGPDGKRATCQIKPDSPRKGEKDKPLKYETPARTGIRLDVHPSNNGSVQDTAEPLWIVEGVKKADALRSRGVTAVALQGVECAGKKNKETGVWLPLPEWEDVRLHGRTVYVCFDSDVSTNPKVEKALERLTGFLQGRGAVPKVIYLPDGENGAKVGADDYLAAGGTVEGMKALAEDGLRRSGGLAGRVLLGDLLRGGIDPTPQLIAGLLYESRIHSIASGAGTGKTMAALYLCVEIMRQGRNVLYLDAENGPNVIAERLEERGAEPELLDEYFHYYPAEITPEPEDVDRLVATVKETEAALVVFDSLADFLALAGMDENSNTDLTKWMGRIAQPVKNAGASVLMLDHDPKNGKGPRGASSKLAKVDVQWLLTVKLPFDRDRTGEIELELAKDREAWLRKFVRFSVGGGVFRQSAGTVEGRGEDGLTDSQRIALEALKVYGSDGAGFGAWKDNARQPQGTFDKARKVLLSKGLVEKVGRVYVAVESTPPKVYENPPVEEGGWEEIEI